jgi:hypothetical protein
MRLGLIVFAVALLAVPANAQQTYRTKSGYIVCISLEKFREQSRLLVSGDRVAWQRFIANRANGCAPLKAGVQVYRESAGIRNIGIIRVRPAGETVWFYTNMEAVQP